MIWLLMFLLGANPDPAPFGADAEPAMQKSPAKESDEGSDADNAIARQSLEDSAYFVRIRYDPAVLPLTEETLDLLLSSTAIARRAEEEAFGGRPLKDSIETHFIGNDGPQGDLEENEGVTIGVITARTPGQPRAREVLTVVCHLLEKALQDASAQAYAELNERLDAAQQNVEEIQSRLGDLQHRETEMREQSGYTDLSRDALLNEVQETRNQIQSLRSDLHATDARQTAITNEISRISTRVQEETARRGLRDNLEHIIAMRRAQLDKFKNSRKQGDDSTDAEIEIEAIRLIAEAQMKLDEYDQLVAARVGGEQLQPLSNELVSLNIDREEKLARLKELEAMAGAGDLQKVLNNTDFYEREIEPQINLTREALRDAVERVDRLQRRIRTAQKPAVIIIGGTTQ